MRANLLAACGFLVLGRAFALASAAAKVQLVHDPLLPHFIGPEAARCVAPGATCSQ